MRGDAEARLAAARATSASSGARAARPRVASAQRRRADCFLARFSSTPCFTGLMARCHLLPQALMRKELSYGLVWVDGAWERAEHPARELRTGRRRPLSSLLRDPRAIVLGCGAGGQGHHGELDTARTLRIPRASLPESVEEFAAEIGLGWWLEREYGA